jgi:hypothetical protein
MYTDVYIMLTGIWGCKIFLRIREEYHLKSVFLDEQMR